MVTPRLFRAAKFTYGRPTAIVFAVTPSSAGLDAPAAVGPTASIDPSTVTRAAAAAQIDVRVPMAPPSRESRPRRGSLPDFPLTDWMLCDMIAPYLQLVSSGTWIVQLTAMSCEDRPIKMS